MAIDKKSGQPAEAVETTTTLTSVQEMQKALEKEYRTDHLTLPYVAPVSEAEKERSAASDLERKIILGGDVTDETVVDNNGTTRKEWRDRIERGIMPKDASKESLDSTGKHVLTVEDDDGDEKVVITAPSGQETTIAYPNLPETDTDFGSELIQQTAAVVETLDNSKTEEPANVPAPNVPIRPVSSVSSSSGAFTVSNPNLATDNEDKADTNK